VNLADELEEAQKKPGTKCSVCLWIATLPPSEQMEWNDAFAKPLSKYSHVSLYEVAKRHGAPIGRTSVSHHRIMGHLQ
jgi:hypothetical protein